MLCLDKRYTTANTEKNYTLKSAYAETFPFNVNVSLEDARYWKDYMANRLGINPDDIIIHSFETGEEATK
jgi:hypothetical protein